MDRRSFLATLIGGLAATSFASAGLAAPPQISAPADRNRPDGAAKVDSDALDKTNAEYAQYYYYGPRRRYWRRRRYWGPRYYWRPRYYYRPWRPYPYWRRRYYYGPRYYW